MADTTPTYCIHCGHSTEQEGRLNRLADGRVCPSCRERLLESLPPLLPRFGYEHEALPAQHLAAHDEAGPDAPPSPDYS
jgi:hypothetical protein